jgi:hypothetical protein
MTSAKNTWHVLAPSQHMGIDTRVKIKMLCQVLDFALAPGLKEMDN